MEKAIVIKVEERKIERKREKGECSIRWKAKCIGSSDLVFMR